MTVAIRHRGSASRVKGQGRDRIEARRRARRRRPALEVMERRELLAFVSFTASSRPRILYPANNRYVSIEVTGRVSMKEKGVVPNVNYRVVDEHRLLQPSGVLKARAVPGEKGSFTFSVSIPLQASVNAKDTSGRLYFITIAARDKNGSVGQVFPVLVPNPSKGAPPHVVPNAAAAKMLGGGRVKPAGVGAASSRPA